MPARRITVVVLAALAAALTASACAGAASSSPRQRLFGAGLHVKRSTGHVVGDAHAHRHRALLLDGRGSAYGTIRLHQRAQAALRVRARSCAGAPRLQVTVGRSIVFAGRVSDRRWRTRATAAAVPAGRHRVRVRLLNPRRRGHCRRAVLVDRIDFHRVEQAPATPAPPSSPETPLGPAPSAGHWTPGLRTSWQWQLTTPVDRSVAAEVYDIDLFDNSADVVAALHAQGRRVVCYLDAGSYEPGRPDSATIPASVQGKGLDGWPGEKWLDIRRLDVLGPIIERRLDLCRQKGFDGVEPDNVDAYTNASGFPLTAADQLRYNRFIADAAHARGLAVGLKNDLDQVSALEPSFDFAVVEQCYQYNECGQLTPFALAGKAVFIAEYSVDPSRFCGPAAASGFSAIRKKLDLDAWREGCS